MRFQQSTPLLVLLFSRAVPQLCLNAKKDNILTTEATRRETCNQPSRGLYLAVAGIGSRTREYRRGDSRRCARRTCPGQQPTSHPEQQQCDQH